MCAWYNPGLGRGLLGGEELPNVVLPELCILLVKAGPLNGLLVGCSIGLGRGLGNGLDIGDGRASPCSYLLLLCSIARAGDETLGDGGAESTGTLLQLCRFFRLLSFNENGFLNECMVGGYMTVWYVSMLGPS